MTEPVTTIRIQPDGAIEVSEPGAKAADLVPVVYALRALLTGPERVGLGFQPIAGTSVHAERRATGDVGHGHQQRGPHRRHRTPDPVVRQRSPEDYIGSNTDRGSRGLPGHCERCARIGHVAAHPDLGCADVGCDAYHPSDGDDQRSTARTAWDDLAQQEGGGDRG
jgi:hypothetical protein